MPTYDSQPDATAGTDAMCFQDNPTQNYETYAHFITRASGANPAGRGLLKFDLSSIPAGSTITGATLYLTVSNAVNNTDTGTVRRILAGNSGWTEAGATWNTRDGTNNWAGSAGCSTSGTDYSATAMGSWSATVGDPAGTLRTITLNTTEVATMLANNYGMTFWADDNAADYQWFYTSDHTTAGDRPRLVITYTSPGQTLTPDGDVAAGGWTSTGASHFAVLADASDATYSQSPTAPAGTEILKVTFSDVSTPGARTGHTISVRHAKDTAGGAQVNVTYDLREGTTLIQSTTYTNITDTPTSETIAITEANATNITDYNNLQLWVTAQQV